MPVEKLIKVRCSGNGTEVELLLSAVKLLLTCFFFFFLFFFFFVGVRARMRARMQDPVVFQVCGGQKTT